MFRSNNRFVGLKENFQCEVEGVLLCRWKAKGPTALSIKEVRYITSNLYVCMHTFKLFVVFFFSEEGAIF